MSISVSDAGRLGGQSKSELKAAAARENGKKGGKKLTPLSEVDCTCGKSGTEHLSTCPRGRAIRYRRQKGLPLE